MSLSLCSSHCLSPCFTSARLVRTGIARWCPSTGPSFRRLRIPRETQRAHIRRGSSKIVMVLTESTSLDIGTTAPSFKLLEPATGKQLALEDIASGTPATLIMFICNHCPFVVHLKEAIVEVAKQYQAKGLAVVAISSNSVVTHPQDGPEKMAEDAKQYGYTFPYLFDESQQVAKAYKAACTPEFYIFDSQQQLQYHGQFDSSRPRNNVPVTGEGIRAALDDVLSGRAVQRPIKPSIGCNIKWAPGNE